jgi:hypothetical protein
MNITLPPELASIIASLIRGAGEDVVLRYADGTALAVRASVQVPGQAPLFNDGYQEGFVVYLSPLDVVVPLQRFDRVEIRGDNRTVEECHGIDAGGKTLAWVLRVLG